MSQIKIKNLNKTVSDNGRKNKILNKINFDVERGEFVCIFGKSGSGKTTLLNLISGLSKPDEAGSLFSLNKTKIGYIFQDDRLLPWLTAGKNISLVIENKSEFSKIYIKSAVNKYLKLVGLYGKKEKYPSTLSGGERQRVAIARALIIKPDILLMDEPFSHLDEITARNIRADVKKICRKENITVLFVTHNPVEAIYFSDRIAVISERKKTISKIVKVPKVLTVMDDYYETLANHRSTQKLLKDLLAELS